MAEIIQTAEDIDAADKLELQVPDRESGEMKHYHSMVQDVTDEGLIVSMPRDGLVNIPLPEGTVVEVSIWKGNAHHRFRSRVLQRRAGHIPVLILSIPAPEDITRTARRQYFRVETRIPGRISMLDADPGEPLEGMILDLSAGGCRLQTTEPIGSETPVLLDFDLPFRSNGGNPKRIRTLREMPGTVKSVSTDTQSEGPAGSEEPIHFLGIEFDELENEVHSALLRYVSFRQRELVQQMTGPGSTDESQAEQADLSQPETALQEAEEDLRRTEEQIQQAEEDAESIAPAVLETEESEIEPEDRIQGLPEPVQEALPEPPEIQPSTGSQAASSGSSAKKRRKFRGKTILVVDGDEVLRAILSQTLRSDGYRVLEANNGQEGLNIARSIQLDLVITDLVLPKLSGWRLLSALRYQELNMPVIIMTDDMESEGQEVLSNTDIDGFLAKPVETDGLLKMVHQALFPKRTNRKRRILAVDDEQDMRLVISTQLEVAGFEVETAANGREAFEKAARFKPDLILLDIVMSGIDGFEVCRRLRERPATADTPIIMLTVKTSAYFVRRAVSLKVNGYIAKPINLDDLVVRIRGILKETRQPGRAGRD